MGRPALQPVAGRKYGIFTATGLSEVRVIKRAPRSYWQVRCDFGCLLYFHSYQTKQGLANCPCSKRFLPGQVVYGALTPTGVVEKRFLKYPKPYFRKGASGPTLGVNQTYWECVCACGVKCFRKAANVKAGITRSCGCAATDNLKSLVNKQKPPGYASMKCVYHSYKRGAAKRGYAWAISKEQFYALSQGNCHYCGAAPFLERHLRSRGYVANGAFKYNGLDRQDNSVGYVMPNLVSCCGVCNRMKLDYSLEKFVKHIALVYHHFVKAKGSI